MKTVTKFPRKVREIENAWITLKDGCHLAARIWLPEDADQHPVPALLEYIPYRKRDGTVVRDHLTHPYLAGHGYACVRVDMIWRIFAPGSLANSEGLAYSLRQLGSKILQRMNLTSDSPIDGFAEAFFQSMAAAMRDRFERYKSEIIRPFYEEVFSGFDRQLVLVDVVGALNAGPHSFDDMNERSVPFSYVISAGVQAVLSLADYVHALADDPQVNAIGLYIEGLNDVPAFARAALKAAEKGKPIVAVKVGRSELGAKLAMYQAEVSRGFFSQTSSQ